MECLFRITQAVSQALGKILQNRVWLHVLQALLHECGREKRGGG